MRKALIGRVVFSAVGPRRIFAFWCDTHLGAGFVVTVGKGWENTVQTADLQMSLHPETLSS